MSRPILRRIIALVVCAGLGAGGGAIAAPSAGVGAEPGYFRGVAHIGRMVADLDASVRFYEALGFTRDAGVDSDWQEDAQLNRLYGIRHARGRVARMLVNSSVSGQPFALYLREFKGIRRKSVADHVAWEPGASHFGLVVPAAATWAQLRAAGQLRARSWNGELIPLPGQTQGALAYLTDPDGLDIEIIDHQLVRPARLTGLDHLGLIVLDSDKARAFYGDVLGGRLQASTAPWMSGDFTDSVVGGHGNVLRFFNEAFAEASAPASSLNLELVEFQNRKKAVARYGIADIGVGYVALEVEGLAALLARVHAAGARVVSTRGIVTLEDGSRAVLIRDPDVGGFVELIERPGSRAR
jgi:catechol 2,3-dioxygenase-like lactoylglutathione lyase family enzyme